MVVGAKVCDLTEYLLWFVCGNFDVLTKLSVPFSPLMYCLNTKLTIDSSFPIIIQQMAHPFPRLSLTQVTLTFPPLSLPQVYNPHLPVLSLTQ